jgi:antitoxin component YwqK of YwqJK toxin-antitoxin module
MKKLILFLSLITIVLSSCKNKCNCDLLYSKDDNLNYSKENDKIYTGICERIYGSGKKQATVEYKEGKLVNIKEYFESGNLMQEVTFDANGKQKLRTFWNENKQKVTEQTFTDGGVKSTLRGWYSNGTDSIDYAWQTDGSLIYQKEYYSDKKCKMDIQFNANASSELVTVNEKNIKNSNDKVFETSYFHYTRCKVGSKIYYPNGQVAAETIKPYEYEYEKVRRGTDIYSDAETETLSKEKIIIYDVFYLSNGYIYKFNDCTNITVGFFDYDYSKISMFFEDIIKIEDAKELQKVVAAMAKGGRFSSCR